MADDPIITEPFDPFFNQAIIYKCPGANVQNTFTPVLDSIARCLKPIFTNPIVDFYRNNPICTKIMAPDDIENLLQASKTCGLIKTIPAGDLQSLSGNNSILCHETEVYLTTGPANKPNCGTEIHTQGEFDRAHFRHCSVLAVNDNFPGFHFCRKLRTSMDMAPFWRTRHLCNIFPIAENLSDRICIPKVTTLVANLTRVNLENCRTTELLDTNNLMFSRTCGIFKFTPNLPNSNGTKNPRVGALTCKIFPIQEPLGLANRICNSQKLSQGNQLIRTIHTNMFCTKIFNMGDRSGMKSRCGNAIETITLNLVFGRVMGGRYPFGAPIRASGRMIGRIR